MLPRTANGILSIRKLSLSQMLGGPVFPQPLEKHPLAKR